MPASDWSHHKSCKFSLKKYNILFPVGFLQKPSRTRNSFLYKLEDGWKEKLFLDLIYFWQHLRLNSFWQLYHLLGMVIGFCLFYSCRFCIYIWIYILIHINICVYIWTEMNKGQSRAKILMYLQGKKHEILYLSS